MYAPFDSTVKMGNPSLSLGKLIWQQSCLLQYALTAIKYVMGDGYDLIFES